MKAIVIHEFGPPDVMKYQDVPDPQPRDGAAAIDVNAVITRVKCDLKNIVLQKANTTLSDGSRPFPFYFLDRGRQKST